MDSNEEALAQAVKAIALILCIDAMPGDKNPEIVEELRVILKKIR